MQRVVTLLVMVLLAPCLMACTGDSGGGEPRPATSSPSDQGVEEAVYRARLEQVPPGGDVDLVLGNRGNRADAYQLRLVPPGAGTVSPPQIDLVAGGEAPIFLDLPVGQAVTIEVFSEAEDKVLTRLEVPAG